MTNMPGLGAIIALIALILAIGINITRSYRSEESTSSQTKQKKLGDF